MGETLLKSMIYSKMYHISDIKDCLANAEIDGKGLHFEFYT